MKTTLTTVLFVLSMLLIPGTLFAGKPNRIPDNFTQLNAQQIKKILSGKTVVGETDDGEFKNVYNPDGSFAGYYSSGVKRLNIKWSVRDKKKDTKDALCIKEQGKSKNCYKIWSDGSANIFFVYKGRLKPAQIISDEASSAVQETDRVSSLDAPTQLAMEEPWAPPEAIAAFEAGRAHYNAGDLKKAMAKLEQAVDIYSDFGDAYFLLETIYIQLKRYQDVIRVLEELKRLNPEQAEKYQASIDFMRSLERTPQAAHDALNRCRSHKAGSKKAIAACREAIRIHPPFAMAHFFLGAQFIHANDEKSAKETLEALIPLGLGYFEELFHVITELKPEWLTESYLKELKRLYAENRQSTKQPTESDQTKLPSDAREPDSGICGDTPAPDTYSVILPEMVRVGDFNIGKYEVTQGEWKAVMGNNSSEFQRGEEYPVERVSWDDVQDFICRLNAKMGKRYRLPTQEEWYLACHAGGLSKRTAGVKILTNWVGTWVTAVDRRIPLDESGLTDWGSMT